MHVTNNCGESVRVKVTYRDGNTDDITLDNNDTQSLEIRGTIFMEPQECEVDVVVYKLDDDTSKVQRTIAAGQNEINIFIKKDNRSLVISVLPHTWNMDK
jgi:hypothetical protein